MTKTVPFHAPIQSNWDGSSPLVGEQCLERAAQESKLPHTPDAVEIHRALGSYVTAREFELGAPLLDDVRSKIKKLRKSAQVLASGIQELYSNGVSEVLIDPKHSRGLTRLEITTDLTAVRKILLKQKPRATDLAEITAQLHQFISRCDKTLTALVREGQFEKIADKVDGRPVDFTYHTGLVVGGPGDAVPAAFKTLVLALADIFEAAGGRVSAASSETRSHVLGKKERPLREVRWGVDLRTARTREASPTPRKGFSGWVRRCREFEL